MNVSRRAWQGPMCWSDTPVTVTFSSGSVSANGMQITDDGERILFLNGVRARFEAPQAEGDVKP
jgi:lipopolysaccharide export system protein LptC